MKLLNLTDSFQKLAEHYKYVYNHGSKVYIKTVEFEALIKKGVYIWIYDNKRIVQVGTATGKEGILKRQKDHLGNLFNGTETFFDVPEEYDDPYEIFFIDENEDVQKYLVSLEEKKIFWIGKSDEYLKHNKTIINNWHGVLNTYLSKISLYVVNNDNNDVAKKIESYFLKKIIILMNATNKRFIQYIPKQNRKNNTFFGNISVSDLKVEDYQIKYKDYEEQLKKYLKPIKL